jgi:hypothetical protein
MTPRMDNYSPLQRTSHVWWGNVGEYMITIVSRSVVYLIM